MARFSIPYLVGYHTLLVGLVMLAVGGCSGPTTLQRGSVAEEPAVDGALDEWGGSLNYVEDEPVSMSVLPTDSLLYVAVSIQDQPLIRSVAEHGLIVWVDPSGEQNRAYGIRYPLGLRMQRAEVRRSGSGGEALSGAPLEDLSLDELEILRGESRRRLPAQFSSGLRAQITLGQGAFVYELAIPVGEGTSDAARHGLTASLDGAIGVGLQTPEEDDESDLPEWDAEGPAVADPSGRGRTRRGGQRGGRRGQQRQRPAPTPDDNDRPTLDLWTKIPADGGS